MQRGRVQTCSTVIASCTLVIVSRSVVFVRNRRPRLRFQQNCGTFTSILFRSFFLSFDVSCLVRLPLLSVSPFALPTLFVSAKESIASARPLYPPSSSIISCSWFSSLLFAVLVFFLFFFFSLSFCFRIHCFERAVLTFELFGRELFCWFW